MNGLLLGLGAGFLCVGVSLYNMGMYNLRYAKNDGGCCVKGMIFLFVGMLFMGLSI